MLYSLQVHAVVRTPTLSVAVWNQTVEYDTAAVFTLSGTVVNALESLAMHMHISNCSGVASVFVTVNSSVAEAVLVHNDSTTDVCLFKLTTSDLVQVNVSVVDTFFGWMPVEFTASSIMSGVTKASSVSTTTLLWLPNTAPIDIWHSSTRLSTFENEVVYVSASTITTSDDLDSDYSVSYIDVVTDGVWVQGVCGPCNTSSMMEENWKRFDGDWSGMIGVVPSKYFSGTLQFNINVLMSSTVFGHRPVVYHHPYMVDVVGVVTVPRLSIAPFNTSFEYGTSAIVSISAATDDMSASV
ncbi:hypothetical protein THRCLA_05764, partial [Thraustotheca clavata]